MPWHTRLEVVVGATVWNWVAEQAVSVEQTRSDVGVFCLLMYWVAELQTVSVWQTRFDEGVGAVSSYSLIALQTRRPRQRRSLVAEGEPIWYSVERH